MSYRKWLYLGIAAVAGCGTGVANPKDQTGSGGGGSSLVDGSVPDGSNPYSNPGDGLVATVDAGVIDIGDGTNGPTCGASSFEPKQVVVDKVVDVPMDVTENVTEEVTEEVPETVSVDVVTTKPTTLYIMLDKSLSMNGGGSWGSPKWAPAVTALKSFVNDTNSAGLGVALQYFPISGNNGGNCSTGSGYSTPAVAAATLPGTNNATIKAISNSLDNHSADGLGTPIEGALRGVTEYCKSFQASKPDEQCVAVLVTDGVPENSPGCETNYDNLAAIAKAAHDAGVITFAIGLDGANFTLLDKIAQQGGAPDCDTTASTYACDVSGDASKLGAALAKIRQTTVVTETHTETHTVTHEVTHEVTHTVTTTKTVQVTQQEALPCTWAVPSSDSGKEFDRNKVNIRLTSDTVMTTFVRVDSKDQCVPNAWYFDDPSNPTSFIACDQTCDEITNATNGKIDILLGCPTITPS